MRSIAIWETVAEGEALPLYGLAVAGRGTFPVNSLGSATYLILQEREASFVGVAQFGGRLEGDTFRASGYAPYVSSGATCEEVIEDLKDHFRD